MRENIDIRDAMKAYGITCVDIAKKLGVSHQYVCKLLGKPLNVKQRGRVILAIRSLVMDDADARHQTYPENFKI